MAQLLAATAEHKRAVLKKFAKGKKVESSEEYKIIDEYSKIGVAKFGFSFKKKEVQAALTKSGKKILGIDE